MNLNTKQFLKVLKTVSKFSESKSASLSLEMVQLKGEYGKLHLSCQDLYGGCRGTVEGLGDFTLDIAVNVKSLVKLVNSWKTDSISLSQESDKLYLKSGKKTASVSMGIPVSDLPDFPLCNVGDMDLQSFDSGQVKSFLNKVVVSVSSDITRFHLNHVLFDRDNCESVAISTNGHTLSKLVSPYQFAGTARFLGNSLKKIATCLTKNGTVDFGINPELTSEGYSSAIVESPAMLHVCNEDYYFWARGGSDRFPSWNKVIPSHGEYKAYVNPADLESVATLIKSVSNQANKGMVLSTKNGTLVAHLVNDPENDIEVFQDVADTTGWLTNPDPIGVNAEYVLDMLKVIDTDQINLTFCDPLDPLVFSAGKDLFLIMPIRL